MQRRDRFKLSVSNAFNTDLSPFHSRALRKIAYSFLGEYRETQDVAWANAAEPLAQHALNNDNELVKSYYLLAAIHEAQGHVNRAREYLLKAQNIEPNNEYVSNLLDRIARMEDKPQGRNFKQGGMAIALYTERGVDWIGKPTHTSHSTFSAIVMHLQNQ